MGIVIALTRYCSLRGLRVREVSVYMYIYIHFFIIFSKSYSTKKEVDAWIVILFLNDRIRKGSPVASSSFNPSIHRTMLVCKIRRSSSPLGTLLARSRWRHHFHGIIIVNSRLVQRGYIKLVAVAWRNIEHSFRNYRYGEIVDHRNDRWHDLHFTAVFCGVSPR